MILDQVRAFAARAKGAGVDCTLAEWPDMFHVWHVFARALDEIGQFVRAPR
jgi:acetyl esterase/lipase